MDQPQQPASSSFDEWSSEDGCVSCGAQEGAGAGAGASSSGQQPDQQQQGGGGEEKYHEWIFRVKVPSESCRRQGTSSDASASEVPGGRTTPSGGSSGAELLELRRAQLAGPSAAAAASARNRRRGWSDTGGSSSEDSIDVYSIEEKTSLLSDAGDAGGDVELRPLDGGGGGATREGGAILEPDEGGGWTFQSPYWSLESKSLLSVTYFPAWQALPEYTNVPKCSSSSSSCASSCCGAPSDKIGYTEFTYSSGDVVGVDKFTINGGDRSGDVIKLHLRPLPPSAAAALPPRPRYLDGAWERQVGRIRKNRAARGLAGSGSGDSDDAATTASAAGPILTFRLPLNETDPPLLWNVEFPVTDEQAIAIESLTVFDGTLLTSTSTAGSRGDQHPSPTHIYINGYQSWSFAGSIPRGHKQPKSALPDAFSRAFNYGGSVPPPADIVVDDGDGGTGDGYRNSSSNSNNNLQAGTRGRGGKRRAHRRPIEVHYQSDFFTCVTSDGQPLPESSSGSNSGLRRPYHRRDGATDGEAAAAPPEAANAPPFQQLIDETGGPAVLLGWLSQRKQFGVITSDVDLRNFQMHASCHGQILVAGVTDTSISTDWSYVQLLSPHSYDEEPMEDYMHAVATANDARPLQNGSLLTGWCSWYFAYERISARLLRDNFAHLAGLRNRVPTNVSVVDDGYMTAWGDWDSVKTQQFPSGMQDVCESITEHGMRPGLWMAPFAADKHSKLTAENPEWVIRNHAGAAANSSHCGKFFYGLDASNPHVRKYVAHCVRRAVVDWGFNVLKIDFLYAACLEGNGKYDLSMSRAEVMDIAMMTIRDAAGSNVFLIGCGCPIATGIGFVDAMRVSADTGPTWYPAFPLPWWDMSTLPSLRSMVRNSLSRAPMGHRWWHNDPDCLMFGEHTRLTNDEIASAASVVAMTCGMLLLSDDLPKVPPMRMRILSKIFPMTGVCATVLDLHCTNSGLPGLLRLWCTDKYDVLDKLRGQLSFDSTADVADHNAEATFLARRASFRIEEDDASTPEERKRSCIHVTRGLGTWTVVSVSNWSDREQVVHIPAPALLPAPTFGWGTEVSPLKCNRSTPSTTEEQEPKNGSRDRLQSRDYGEHGYHVFEFWCGRYSWLPAFDEDIMHSSKIMISKKLSPHATEIFHIKPVTPDTPQYVGSDLHFSCGRELLSFRHPSRNRLVLRLGTDYRRSGCIYVFIPRASTSNVRVTIRGEAARWTTIGNVPKVNDNGSPRLLGRVIGIPVVVKADGTSKDGHIDIHF